MKDEDIKSYFQQMLETLNKIVDTQEKINKYIIETSKKHNDEDIKLCFNILENNKYITTTMIKDDPILGLKYGSDVAQKRLLDQLFYHNKDLTFIKTGQGNKRYIFKKEDEKEVRNSLKIKRVNYRHKIKFSEYEAIKFGIEQLANKFSTVSTRKLHDFLGSEYEIKQPKKKADILRRLAKDGIIKPNGGCFILEVK